MKKYTLYKEEKAKRKQTKEYINQLNPQTNKDKVNAYCKRIWDHKTFYIMLIPAVVLLIIFAYQPMYGVIIAFKDFSFRQGITGSKWVGFDNFETLFQIEQFWVAFKNTININVLKFIFGF